MRAEPILNMKTFTIMGITGRVGGAAARALLKSGAKVRGIVRDRAKTREWEGRGVELVTGDALDTASLVEAFRGADGVFVMVPPNFAPAAGYPETAAVLVSVRAALEAARPGRVVGLSSVGAQHPGGLGLITQCQMLEEALGSLSIDRAFIRAAWFMENFEWDVATARERGGIDAYLTPLDREFPMIATRDIGQLVAKILEEPWTGRRVLELEGPRRYSQDDAAAVFSRVLDRPVRAKAVAREEWAAIFEGQGMPADRTGPRIEMLDGFNSGWIDFEAKGTEKVVGETALEEVVKGLAG
ncbi:MAG: NmrA family transcriptional regulator [Akkermansiaceae bacterium]|nr:NmrA family transcriptional regulator [Akkermansiaceae bacterium]